MHENSNWTNERTSKSNSTIFNVILHDVIAKLDVGRM